MSNLNLAFAITGGLLMPVLAGFVLNLGEKYIGKQFGCETEKAYLPNAIGFALWFFFTTGFARVGANEAIRLYNTELQEASGFIAIYIVWASAWIGTLGCGLKKPRNLEAGFASAVCTLMIYFAIVYESLRILA